MAKKVDTVVRRIDCTLDKKILEIKDLVEVSTGKPVQYKDASKMTALFLKNPSLVMPMKKEKSSKLLNLDDLSLFSPLVFFLLLLSPAVADSRFLDETTFLQEFPIGPLEQENGDAHLIGLYCPLEYNSEEQYIIDTSCLKYETEANGVITVNDTRFLAFGIKGTVGGQVYNYTSMDFSWTWHVNESNGDYTFWAENDHPTFIWKQYYNFYSSQEKQMKITHHIQNDLASITDATFFYLSNVLPTDTVEYNGTTYFTNNMTVHKKGNFTHLVQKVNFNSTYDFRFQDLVDDGFDITEFYIGNGSVIGVPQHNITAIGFTKNNGFFPKGQDVWVDPQFSTNDIEDVMVVPLEDTLFALWYCDETTNQYFFGTYWANGTAKYTPTFKAGGNGCTAYDIGMAPLNSSWIVLGHYEGVVSKVNILIVDSSGNLKMFPMEVHTPFNTQRRGHGIAALNASHFVVCFVDENADDLMCGVWSNTGMPVTAVWDVDTNVGASSTTSVDVSAFNHTHFVVVWNDKQANDVTFHTYEYDGTSVSGETDVDTNAADATVSVAAINSTAFAVAFVDDNANDVLGATYEYDGTAIDSSISFDTSVSESESASISLMNSSALVVTWYDADIVDTYDYAVIEPDGDFITSSTTLLTPQSGVAYNDESVTSEILVPAQGLCNDTFIFAFVNSSTDARWNAYWPDGTSWNGTCSSGGAADLSFTLGYPSQGCTVGEGGNGACTKCWIETTDLTGKATESNVACQGQNSTVPFFNFTNTGDTALKWSMMLNASLPADLDLSGDTDNNPTGEHDINSTSYWVVNSSVPTSKSEEAWMWGDFTASLAQETNRNVTSLSSG